MAKKTKTKNERYDIEWVAIETLTPYKNNARINDQTVPYLKNSIERFGFKIPLVIDADGVVVCGHTRLKAALELGYSELPCVRATDLSPEEIKAFRLVDNKVQEISSWDLDKLDFELGDLGEDFGDLSDFGFAKNADSDSDNNDDDGIEIKETFEVIVSCSDEYNLQETYERLTKEGFECRISTL